MKFCGVHSGSDSSPGSGSDADSDSSAGSASDSEVCKIPRELAEDTPSLQCATVVTTLRRAISNRSNRSSRSAVELNDLLASEIEKPGGERSGKAGAVGGTTVNVVSVC